MLKLKRFSSGDWFEYPKAKGVELKIRPLGLSDGLSIRSKIRMSKPVEIESFKTKAKITTLMEDFDTGEYAKKIFDFCLVDFRGPITIESDEGEVELKTLSIEEAKMALFDDPDVRQFVEDVAEKMQGTELEKLREELKNWNVSQSG